MSDSYQFSSPFRSAVYKLTEEGVAVTSKKFGRFTRTSVPFDHIPVHSSTISWSSKPLLWVAAILTVFLLVVVVDLFFDAHPEPAALALYGGLDVIVIAVYFVTRVTSEVFAFEGEHISLFRRTANDEKLRSFIQAMQERKLEFFKRRLVRRSAEVPSEELARYLIYLRESDLIDDNGYGLLRSSLDYLYSKKSSIGFHEGN